jgi:hypothetical protein
VSRLPLQTNARAGTVALVEAYRQSASLTLGQLYRARPAGSPKVPSIYIDRITEGADSFSAEESQRVVVVALRCVWGVYNTGDAVDQRDRFVDGLYGYLMDSGKDAFGANAVIYWRTVTDNPDWTPEWLPESDPYYMTEITLEGHAST